MLKQDESIYISGGNYSKITYGWNLAAYRPGDFFRSDRLAFENHLKDCVLKPNQLLCYPALAQELRAIQDYPILKREFMLPAAILNRAGALNMMRALVDFMAEAESKFENEREKLSVHVQQLIKKSQAAMVRPVVTAIHYHDYAWAKAIQSIDIGGLNWQHKRNSSESPFLSLNLRELIKANGDEVRHIELEDGLIGTCFILLRLHTSKSYKAKGRARWFDLESLSFVDNKTVAPYLKIRPNANAE